jgi:DHA3 family tetracycline resistance protein-like MFS transporter
VLLPFVVKHKLADGARDLGLIFAAGGLGSLACAVAIGQTGLPRRSLVFMYITWTAATLAVAGYGLAQGLWGLMLASVLFNTLETAGTIAWATAKQRHVPAALLGRVSSLDWLISIGLLPVSYALAGPVSSAIGVRSTLIGAGVLGAVVTFAPLLIPSVRRVDDDGQPDGVALEASAAGAGASA